MYGRKALYFIMGGTFLVLIVLLSAYIVFMRFRPETEIQRMLRAMSKVQTVRQQSAFSWARGEGKARVATSLYLVGQADVSALPAVEQDTRFRMFRLKKTKGYADLSGEIRTVDGVTYLTYAPPGPTVAGVSFSEDETWVSFPDGDLPKWGSILPGMDAPIVTMGAAGAWTDAGILRMRELLTLADVFLVRYDDVTEIVDGHATRLIEARFDPDAIRAFLADIIRAREGRDPTNPERVVIEAQAVALEGLSARLWIGTKDHLLYRFQVAGSIAEEGESAGTSVDMLVNLTDFDAAFDGAAVPSSAIVPVAAVFASAFGTLQTAGDVGMRDASAAPLLANDASRLPAETFDGSNDADRDGLSAVLEAFYRTNPNVADTDGDGVSDGDEVFSGKNPNGKGSLFSFGLGT